MISKKLGRILISLGAFSIGVAGIMGLSVVVSADGGGDDSQAVVTTSEEDAKEAAGYDIVTPGYIPEGMELKAYIVDAKKRDNKADSVEQYWQVPGENGSGQWFIVMQGPRPAGLVDSGSSSISDTAVERVLYESGEERPYAIVALMWPAGDGFLSVVGSIKNDQTEATLRQVAESMISR